MTVRRVPPKHPTHTVRHIDNWDGEPFITTSLAFMVDEVFYYHDNGKPIIAYAGDEILRVWTHDDNDLVQQNKALEHELSAAHTFIGQIEAILRGNIKTRRSRKRKPTAVATSRCN